METTGGKERPIDPVARLLVCLIIGYKLRQIHEAIRARGRDGRPLLDEVRRWLRGR